MSENTLTNIDHALIERVVIDGDLSKLSAEQRVAYYRAVCESLGLNPLTRPFDYIRLNGRLVLYAKRDAADQLRKLHGISIDRPTIEFEDDLVIVTVTGHDKTGRTDSDLGVVPLGNLRGDARANAILKAITKAKRRLTLSLVGLGWLDETEVETIPDAEPVVIPETTRHWTEDERIRKRFWAWTRSELSLTDAEVHEALGVEHVRDFPGTPQDAKERILAWIDARALEQEAKREASDEVG